MRSLRKFWRSTRGASAAEYALILAVVGSALAAAAMVLGGVIGGEMNETARCIVDQESC